MKTNYKGFTLVELIVVITIIGMMFTFLFTLIDCEEGKTRDQGICITEEERIDKDNEWQEGRDIVVAENKIKSKISFCKDQAKSLVNGTMSDSWGNDDYNTKYPSELMDKVYFSCLEEFNNN